MSKKKNKNVQTFSIEGKDVLSRYYKTNKITKRKGSLDDSMEVDKLKKISKSIIKLNKNNHRYYTDDIITVNFKYACKQDRDLTDEEFERVESLNLVSKLITDKEKIKELKELIKIAKRDISKKEIRNQLYEYGFNININGKNKHFVRYKRTSGSARVGKVLFINSKFSKQMIDWSFAGIPHEIGTEMDCAGMEAYISLPTSSAIDRFKLKPENILMINDEYSTFKDTVMATKLINEEYDKEGNIIGGDLDTNVETIDITNNLFDGEMILDKSIFEENGYGDKATLQIRNILLKGIGVNGDIQSFFRDNQITEISQLNGKTIATDISQIKLICTPSSVKYMKFGTFEKWLTVIEEDWAICKYEKPQHHFNGMVQTHYQLLNTLGMDKANMREFLSDTINYINLLKTDISVFKYHLGINSKIESEDDIEEKTELSSNIDSSNSFILNMLEINEDFENTKICKNYRAETIKSYIKNARKGHILVNGNYSIIVSCPYEYLLASIGKFDGSSLLKPFECVSSKFGIGKTLVAVRSPEPTMSNITTLTNVENKTIEKYFNTNSKEVCYMSPIDNNIMELLSSCDFDGDAFEISDDELLVKHALGLQESIDVYGMNISRFLVSTDFTPKSSIKRKYTPLDLSDTDVKCSENKIGEIINMAQTLNSLYWDMKSKGSSEEDLFDLYKDISNLNILSCIEIDRAKKISPVNAKKELDKIRNKYSLGKDNIVRNGEKKEVKVRPYFFKYLDGGKDYKFKKFNTGMDFLNIVIDEDIKKWQKGYSKEINLVDILVKLKASKADRKLINTIKLLIKKNRDFNSKVWASDSKTKYIEIMNEKELLYSKLSKYTITKEVIYSIISRINKSNTSSEYEEYKKIGLTMMTALYNCQKKEFLNCIQVKANKNKFILFDKCGIDGEIYGIPYKVIEK